MMDLRLCFCFIVNVNGIVFSGLWEIERTRRLQLSSGRIVFLVFLMLYCFSRCLQDNWM